MKIKSGGGLTSNKVVQSKHAKSEPVSRKASPAGAAQLGAATQFRKENLIGGKGYEPGPKGSTGLSGTYNPAREGPGSGRTTYRSGSQSQTPQANEMPKGRDTLSEFGPGKRGG
jgi:hypothetical protein